MVSKNRGTCGFLATSWVLITMAPRNSDDTIRKTATSTPNKKIPRNVPRNFPRKFPEELHEKQLKKHYNNVATTWQDASTPLRKKIPRNFPRKFPRKFLEELHEKQPPTNTIVTSPQHGKTHHNQHIVTRVARSSQERRKTTPQDHVTKQQR